MSNNHPEDSSLAWLRKNARTHDEMIHLAQHSPL